MNQATATATKQAAEVSTGTAAGGGYKQQNEKLRLHAGSSSVSTDFNQSLGKCIGTKSLLLVAP